MSEELIQEAKAFEKIAKLCGDEDWECPGQVVRRVQSMARQLLYHREQVTELSLELAAVYRALNGADPDRAELRRTINLISSRRVDQQREDPSDQVQRQSQESTKPAAPASAGDQGR